jgi:hypothetical protein
MSESATHDAIEAVARDLYGRLAAYIASRTGDIADAQDAGKLMRISNARDTNRPKLEFVEDDIEHGHCVVEFGSQFLASLGILRKDSLLKAFQDALDCPARAMPVPRRLVKADAPARRGSACRRNRAGRVRGDARSLRIPVGLRFLRRLHGEFLSREVLDGILKSFRKPLNCFLGE